MINSKNSNRVNKNQPKIKINPITTRLMLLIALSIPLVLGIIVNTLPHQVANAQLTAEQQQTLNSLVTTGFTNKQMVTVGGQNFSIPYSIHQGQVVGIIPSIPTTSIDVIIAPTQHAKTIGIFTIQIPRHLLDSKNPNGTDKPFRVTIDGHGLTWKELKTTNTDRTIGAYFIHNNGFLQIYGTQIVH